MARHSEYNYLLDYRKSHVQDRTMHLYECMATTDGVISLFAYCGRNDLNGHLLGMFSRENPSTGRTHAGLSGGLLP